MTEKERAKAMYAKGYRYRINFENDKITPLYAQTVAHIAELFRTMYKHEKNWKATRIDADGNDVNP